MVAGLIAKLMKHCVDSSFFDLGKPIYDFIQDFTHSVTHQSIGTKFTADSPDWISEYLTASLDVEVTIFLGFNPPLEQDQAGIISIELPDTPLCKRQPTTARKTTTTTTTTTTSTSVRTKTTERSSLSTPLEGTRKPAEDGVRGGFTDGENANTSQGLFENSLTII